MGELATDNRQLEDAILKALETHFTHHSTATNNARTKFYNSFQNEADEHDRDFVKKCGGDLDTTLIFAGLFSAVASAFILAVQTELQPDYGQLSHDLLRIMAQANNLTIPPEPSSDTPWNGPDSTLVRVQAVLFSSLAVSLLAAFLAMLGKQWLNRYSRVDMRGSLIDRSRDRQRKMNGMTTWHFDFVMEVLPLLLQFALLLLGYALSTYLFTIDSLIAWVVSGFTASSFLFYVILVVAAALSYDCPFQTPYSLMIHSVVRFDDKHRRYLKRVRGWLRRVILQVKEQQRQKTGRQDLFGTLGTFDGRGDHIELAMGGPPDNSPTIFEGGADWEGYILDSNCIAWMFKKSVDEEVVQEIMKFIPEVVWHQGIETTPLGKLYDIVLDCFDCSVDRPVVIHKFQKKAYLTAKAFVHLAIQRKCIDAEPDKAVFESIAKKHQQSFGAGNYKDSDLESTLGMMDRVLGTGVPRPMRWGKFTFTHAHHSWMAHILLYRASYALKADGKLPDDIKEFVLHSLRLDPPPPASIISDCLLIVSLVLGMKLDNDDHHLADRSQKIRFQIMKIYAKLNATFQNPNSSALEIDNALDAMRLIAPLPNDGIALKSYSLFRFTMRATISPAYSEEKKWEASRLALHGAYKWDKVLPWVDDPQDILAFLNHHFELIAKGGNHDGPIQYALRALAYASNQVTIDALEQFDPTAPSFVSGICSAFQDGRPFKLRKAALFFLPLIADRWFNTLNPIMTLDQMKSFCVDWASAIDEIGDNTRHVQKVVLAVLFDMINSPHWRPHIVPEKWKLLEHFRSASDNNSQSLKRCLDNPDLLQEILEMGNPDAAFLWPAILWLRYNELKLQIQRELEEVTRGAQKWDYDRYLSTIEDELHGAETSLTGYNTWANDPRASALRTKIDDLGKAIGVLVGLRRS